MLLWVVCITCSLLISTWRADQHVPRRVELAYHAFVWPFAWVAGWLPVAVNHQMYGVSGMFCWLRKEHIGWRVATYYAPFTVAMAFVLITYVLILYLHREKNRAKEHDSFMMRRVKSTPNLAHMSARRDYAPSLTLYPVVFLICWSIPVVVQLVLYFGHRSHTDSLTLLVLDALTPATPMLGFANMLVFYYAEIRATSFFEVLHRVRALLICSCLRRSHHLAEYETALLDEFDVADHQLTEYSDSCSFGALSDDHVASDSNEACPTVAAAADSDHDDLVRGGSGAEQHPSRRNYGTASSSAFAETAQDQP